MTRREYNAMVALVVAPNGRAFSTLEQAFAFVDDELARKRKILGGGR